MILRPAGAQKGAEAILKFSRVGDCADCDRTVQYGTRDTVEGFTHPSLIYGSTRIGIGTGFRLQRVLLIRGSSPLSRTRGISLFPPMICFCVYISMLNHGYMSPYSNWQRGQAQTLYSLGPNPRGLTTG